MCLDLKSVSVVASVKPPRNLLILKTVRRISSAILVYFPLSFKSSLTRMRSVSSLGLQRRNGASPSTLPLRPLMVKTTSLAMSSEATARWPLEFDHDFHSQEGAGSTLRVSTWSPAASIMALKDSLVIESCWSCEANMVSSSKMGVPSLALLGAGPSMGVTTTSAISIWCNKIAIASLRLGVVLTWSCSHPRVLIMDS
jgi:hypothetical protein